MNLNKVPIPWNIYSVVRDKQGKIQMVINPVQRIKSGMSNADWLFPFGSPGKASLGKDI